MQVGSYVQLVRATEEDLGQAYIAVGRRHAAELDIEHPCELFAEWSQENSREIQPFVKKYRSSSSSEAGKLYHDLFNRQSKDSLALLRDLHHLWLMAQEAHISWTVLLQTATALRDEELKALCQNALERNHRQLIWLRTRIKSGAPQTLIAGPT